MTQVPPTTDTGDPPPGTPPGDQQPDPAELSRRQQAAQDQKTRDLELTNLMLRAGLDPEAKESPTNALFFKAYEGDLTNEAVTEAAKGYGLIQETPPPTGDVTDPDERRQTGERQQAAAGSVPDGNAPTEDPRVSAIKAGEEVLIAGGTEEAAMGAAFDTIAAAGYGSMADGRKPDRRAQFIPGEDDPRRPDQGW